MIKQCWTSFDFIQWRVATWICKHLAKSFGKHSLIGMGFELNYPENLFIGDNVLIGKNVKLNSRSKIILEDNVKISGGAMLLTGNFTAEHKRDVYSSKPIIVKRFAWIASNAIILGGVTIGEYATIATGTIVTHDVPAHTLVAGVPAKIVKEDKQLS